jgi:hypothetical protein
MCFFSAPKAPQIVYQGPSQEDIAANQSRLDSYKQMMTTQQDSFAKQLQAQIDAASSKTESTKKELESLLAQNSAAASNQQTTTYAVATSATGDPEGAQTASGFEQKQKPKTSLKITPGGATAASAGTGLNIGV